MIDDCKYCGQRFFTPFGDDGDVYDWQWSYCSRKCWENSEEYNLNHAIVSSFVTTLNKTQLEMFRKINTLSGDYYYLIAEVINDTKFS